jgi:2-polyprenyl-3-methyl-5-hydroxy-6-metoxy-1,4-benzoquinol methylase
MNNNERTDKLNALSEEKWPENGLESILVCPVCGGEKRELLYSDLTDRIFYCTASKWILYKCGTCGSAFLNPRPTSETISNAYSKYFTHTIDSNNNTKKKKIPFAQIRLALRNGYLNKKYGYKFSPANKLGYFLALIFPLRRLSEDRSLRNLKAPEPGSRILDIGCGNGSFLLNVRDFGWIVEGVEPDEKAASLAVQAGLFIHKGSLIDVELAKEYYDVITLHHVIEHFHDPGIAIKKCFQILRPGGILWVATPNLNSMGYYIFRENWIGLDPPRHLLLFTKTSLTRIVENAGFIILSTPPATLMTEWFYQVSQAIYQGVVHPLSEPPVLNKKWKLRAYIAKLQSLLYPELSEELIMIAKKPINRLEND